MTTTIKSVTDKAFIDEEIVENDGFIEEEDFEFTEGSYYESSFYYDEESDDDDGTSSRSGTIYSTNDLIHDEDYEAELGMCAAKELSAQEALDMEYEKVANLRLIEVAGEDKLGRRLVVLSACRLPPLKSVKFDQIYAYIRSTLIQYVSSDYALIYFHHGLNSTNRPSFKWLKKCYRGFNRDFKKNLKALYVVHPTSFVKFAFSFFKPLVSSKFGRKLSFIYRLSDLEKYIDLNSIPIPDMVTQNDNRFDSKRKSPAKSSNSKPNQVESNKLTFENLKIGEEEKIVWADRQQFGVSLKHIASHNSNDPISFVLIETVNYIRESCLDLEGLFQRSSTKESIEAAKCKMNNGVHVSFEEESDKYLAPVLLKLFLRELSDPIIPEEMLDGILRITNTPLEQRINVSQSLLFECLPAENYKVLKYLIEFLNIVSEHSNENKMNTAVLGVIFSPNLVWTKNANRLSKILMTTGQVNSFLRFLIENSEAIFI